MSSCLFCAAVCPLKVKFVGGKITKVAEHPSLKPKELEFDWGEDSSIGEQLKVLFVLKNVLNVSQELIVGFLGAGNPELWISLCGSCEETIKSIYDALRELRRLEKLIISLPIELKSKIIDSQMIEGQSPNLKIWYTIRGEILKEHKSSLVQTETSTNNHDLDSGVGMEDNLMGKSGDCIMLEEVTGKEIQKEKESNLGNGYKENHGTDDLRLGTETDGFLEEMNTSGDVQTSEFLQEEPNIEQKLLAPETLPSEPQPNLGPQSDKEALNSDGEGISDGDVFQGNENDSLFEEEWHIGKVEVPESDSLATEHYSNPEPICRSNLEGLSHPINKDEQQLNCSIITDEETEDVSTTPIVELRTGIETISQKFKHLRAARNRKASLTATTTGTSSASSSKRVVLVDERNVESPSNAGTSRGSATATKKFPKRNDTRNKNKIFETSVPSASTSKRVVLNSKGKPIRTFIRKTSTGIKDLESKGARVVEYKLSDLPELQKQTMAGKRAENLEKKVLAKKRGQGKNFICSKCKAELSTNYNLKRHLEEKHPEELVVFHCKEGNCIAKYKVKRDLVAHLKTHSTDFQPKTCQDCGQQFVYSQGVGGHQRNGSCKGPASKK